MTLGKSPTLILGSDRTLTLQYRWDFDNDGFWDTPFASTPMATHIWNDEYEGNALLEVFDGVFKDVDEFKVKIHNAPLTSMLDQTQLQTMDHQYHSWAASQILAPKTDRSPSSGTSATGARR